MNDRTSRVFRFLSWTIAPGTGLSFSSVTMPLTDRSGGSLLFFLLWPSANDAIAMTTTKTRNVLTAARIAFTDYQPAIRCAARKGGGRAEALTPRAYTHQAAAGFSLITRS